MPTSTYIYFAPCTCPTKSGASHDILLNMTSQVKTVNNPRQTHDQKTVNNHCNVARKNALLSNKHDEENMEKTQGVKCPHFPENIATTALIWKNTLLSSHTMEKTWRKPTENPRSNTASFFRKHCYHCSDLKKTPYYPATRWRKHGENP